MTPISERYRPGTLSEFLGNARTVAAARWWIDRGVGGKTFWIAGASGTGKTTLARILARSIADPPYIVEYESADGFGVAEVEELKRSMTLTALGKGGRAWIVNEAHGLRAPIVRSLLGVLEPGNVPRHCLVVFTTTTDGQAALIDGIDGGPLLSRCTPLTLSNQGLSVPFAERFRAVALSEGFDVPPAKCRRLVQEFRNNLRACYEWLGSPDSMDYLVTAAAAAVKVA